jgi:hypothetical protein
MKQLLFSPGATGLDVRLFFLRQQIEIARCKNNTVADKSFLS